VGIDYERINVMIRQSDGKIVAIGYVSVGVDEYLLLTRYNADGTLDNTYGDQGSVILGNLGGYYSCKAFAAALQKDGKIVVAGSVSNSSFATDPTWVMVARFDQDGVLDKSFNSTGFLILKLGVESSLSAIAVLPDGKILAAGTIEQQSIAVDFLAIRCGADGILDKNFGTDGIAITDFDSSKDYCTSLAVLSNGYFYLAGYTLDAVNMFDFALAKFNSYGRLDYSFSLDGKVSMDFFGYSDIVNAVAVQPDGKVIIGGDVSNVDLFEQYFTLVRYTSTGALDATFDKDGKVTTLVNGYPVSLNAIGIQSDNKILAAGNNGDFTLIRYNTNGSLDPTFSDDGMVSTDIKSFDNFSNCLILLPDRKIIVGGYSSNKREEKINLLKYNTDGTLDNSFNSGGIVELNINFTQSMASSMKILDNGKIIVGGTASFQSYDHHTSTLYSKDGQLDPTYNGNGIFIGWGLDPTYCTDLAVQRDGKIVQVGYDRNKWDPDVFMLHRILQDGHGDRSFGDIGFLTTDVGPSSDRASCVAIQADDKILVGGYSHNGNDWDFSLVRYLPNGTLDPGFSNDGKVITDIGSVNNGPEAIALQKDGKIILGGFTEVNNQLQFALLRYTPEGMLDPSFNTTGKVILNVSPDGDESIYAVLVQDDGKILVAGDAFNGTNTDFAIIRLNSNGSLDNTFSGDGKLLIDINANYNDAIDVALLPNGKIILAGTCIDKNKYVFSIIKLHQDGRMDDSFGNHGIAIIAMGTGDNIAAAVALQKDGKIIIAGSNYEGYRTDFTVARLISELNVGVVNEKSNDESILIYPNPIYNDAILEYILMKEDVVNIQLYDLNGRLIQGIISNEKKAPGNYTEKIHLPERLKDGHYLLVLKTTTGMATVKLTKRS
jgi:uncharacterized delta-60 repeat protein